MIIRSYLLFLSVALLLMLALAGCNRQEAHPLYARLTPAEYARATRGPSSGGTVLTQRKHPTANAIQFLNVANAAGVHYQWKIPGPHPLNILQTIGNGCAFLDYNNDGNLDILLVGPQLALYKGDGHGHFTDVTHETGLDRLHGHFLGCAVGDYDNDGYDDLYISGYQTGLLLHNEAGRAFRDVTREAGLQPQPWGTSCGFADLDGDGYLDLYVANYVEFGPKTNPQLCPEQGHLTSCSPSYYRLLQGVVYHNLHGRRFEETTAAWGLKTHSGKGLGIAFADFDGSGRMGLAVANDEIGGDLFQNHLVQNKVSSAGTSGQLQNINLQSGTAVDKNGKAHGGMGIDWGDVDNDGKLDLFVTTFRNETKCLYHNEGSGLFSEISAESDLLTPTLPWVGFGCKFLDADNDGWLDILIANGHVQDNITQIDKKATYRQAVQFLHNDGVTPVAFGELTHTSGLDRLPPIVGRGLAVGDFDNDGRMDALVVDAEGKPLLLHNETRNPNHWIGFQLIGSGKSNRDALGAQVTVVASGQKRLRQCHPGGSYLSSSDKRVHVGLAGAKQAESVEVRWPDGKAQVWKNLPADRYHTLREKN